MSEQLENFSFATRLDYNSLFRHLEVFIKIVDSKNISVAANRLNLTSSATSRILSQLEEKLGVVLFKRTTRSLVLTEAGKYLYERSLIIMRELEESLVQLDNFQHFPQGELRITCSIAFATAHLIKIIGDYKDINSEVNLLVDLNDQFVKLNEEDFDIAIRITSTPPDNYATRKICDIHWVYCGSHEYFEKNGIPNTIDDLDTHTCLINPNILDRWHHIDNNIYSSKFKKTIKMNSSIGLLHAAINGQGIVCLPTYMLNQHIINGELKPILLDYAPVDPQYSLYILYHPSKFSIPKIRSFIDFFRNSITNPPFWDEWM